MKMHKVESSNIDLIGYQEKYSIGFSQKPTSVLRIYFNNGRIYDYYNVAEETFEKFLKAESPGSFFHKFINKHYEYELVT